jgi:protein SCO1
VRRLIVIVSLAVLGSGVLWQATDGARAVTSEGARRLGVLRDAPEIPRTALTDMSGKTLALQPPAGGVALVEFIYATCPTICVDAGAAFAQLKQRLADAGLDTHTQLFSISFDPDRDNVATLRHYADAHGADGTAWTVAVPSVADLPGLLDRFGIVVIPDPFGGYQHNAAIHVVDDRRRLTGIFDIDDLDGVMAAISK